MNKAAVTGAAGFVGSALVRKLLNSNVEVYAIDIIDNPTNFPINNELLHYIKADMFNIDSIYDALKDKCIDTMYHFAWVGSSGQLRNNIDCQIKNAISTVNLLKVCKSIGCSRFVCAGSIMEYETISAIYAQGNQPQLSYIYGAGKILAHLLCKPVANELDIDLIWAYITNAFGVGELSPRLVNSTIRKCIHKQELLFTSGEQNYDFVYIDDVANAFYLIGTKGIRNKGYIIGSGKAAPLRNFIKTLVYTCDKNAKPIFGTIPFTGENMTLDTFSISELTKDCGFVPKYSFEEGIRLTYEWLKQQEEEHQ